MYRQRTRLSVAPKRDAGERKRQAALLPTLVSGLNQGLEQIGASADARRLFMDALMDLNLAAIRGGRSVQKEVPDLVVSQAAVSPPAVEAPVAALHVTHSVENGVRLEEVSLQRGPQRPIAVPGIAPASVASNTWCAVTGSSLSTTTGKADGSA